MLKQVIEKVLGTRFEREQKQLRPIVAAIHAAEEQLSARSDDYIQARTAAFRATVSERCAALVAEVDRLRDAKRTMPDAGERAKIDRELRAAEDALKKCRGEILDEILPEAFATVREACRRLQGSTAAVLGHEIVWDMVPYDVQLIGGIVLHQGKIAEMATGEGKTLVATLPLYLNALTGQGSHLVTVNNYLARRDSQWMGHLFRWLGLTVGCIDDTEPSSKERYDAYRCDITYGTNNEFGFDYLRDNMVFSLEQRVQRSHVYAIIDEVDSILIDEARTPLIISGPVGTESDQEYQRHNQQVVALVRRQGEVVNELVARGEPLLEAKDSEYEGAVQLFKAQLGIPKHKRLLKLLQEPAVKQLVQRVELDHLADRKLPSGQRQFKNVEDELFFVMDEKGHSVHLTDRGVETLSPDDPSAFVVPDIWQAVHDLDLDEALTVEDRLARRRQLEAEYAAKSERLHIIHKLLQAHALYEKDVDYVVQEGQVFIVDEFTGRLMPGRRWSDGLHQAVEAKEGVTVRSETQTLATVTIQNYFRMYDKLSGMTGTAETEETEFFQIYGLDVVVIPTNRPVRRIDKHDLIYRTRREKYAAVIDEVERQHARGLPALIGTTSVEVSETLSRMLKRRGLKHEVLNAKYHQREAEIVAQAGRAGAITIATNMAGRGTDIKLGQGVKRCAVCGIKAKLAPFGQQLEQPDLSREEINGLGCQTDPPCGLVIVGTERHEARRIDRQLRGRSGRQGDPGQSEFYLSLEDDLMRLFGSDRNRLLKRALEGLEEGEAITHPMVTRAIEQAQKRVELQNFQQRKRLLEYDDVMNNQREVVYALRRYALEGGEELKGEALDMIKRAVAHHVDDVVPEGVAPADWDRRGLEAQIFQRFFLAVPGVDDAERVPDERALRDAAEAAVEAAFQSKLGYLAELQRQVAHPDLPGRLLADVMLGTIDEKWKDHLYDLDQLRAAIQYRAWGQKDPLIEYKQEAFEMFDGLMHDIAGSFAERFLKLQVQVGPAAPPPALRRAKPAAAGTATKAAASDLVPGAEPLAGPPRPSPSSKGDGVPKVGRNDPCPCGSGKKYKKCHGAGT